MGIVGVVAIAGATSCATTPAQSSAASPSSVAVSRFQDWDADGNGALNRSEFIAGMNEAQLLSNYDRDGDGVVAYSEFEEARLENVISFETADRDRDLFIDDGEFSASLFSRWDVDANGTIARQELPS